MMPMFFGLNTQVNGGAITGMRNTEGRHHLRRGSGALNCVTFKRYGLHH